MNEPRFKKGDVVDFIWRGTVKRGTVYIMDAHGTFEQWEEPFYDIETEEDLYKHLRVGSNSGIKGCVGKDKETKREEKKKEEAGR